MLGILALLAGVICWGVTPVILRRLRLEIDAWTANGIRYPLAAIVYWPLLIIAMRAGRLNQQIVRRCLFPAFFALGGQVFWALSFYYLSASEAGFFLRLATVWSVVGSILLFRDERQLLARPGFYLGVSGLGFGFLTMASSDVIFSGHGTAPPTETGGENYFLGLTYILLCGMFFGCYMVSVRKCIADVDPLLAFGVVANLVSVGTIIGMLLQGDVTLITQQTPFAWVLIISSSMLGVALGHIMMFISVQRLGAAISSSCQTLMPFVTAAVASVALAEKLSTQKWIGGCIMVVGAIVLLSIEQKLADNPSEAESSH